MGQRGLAAALAEASRGVVGLVVGLVVGCGTPRGESGTLVCPPCECACVADGEPARTPGPAADLGSPLAPASAADLGSPLAATDDLGEQVASASRRMMHGDGAGCLAELDRIAAIDPKLEARLAVTRGQCEMLVGRCQDGKERIARWYQEETNMHPEQAARTADSLASMRCRGGDSSDRDRLRVALFELQQGAYVGPMTPKLCAEHVATVRALGPRVKLAEFGDDELRGGQQALFYTAAQCFARAGDCVGAAAVFAEFFPREGLAAIGDPKAQEAVVRDAFRESIDRCRGPAAPPR